MSCLQLTTYNLLRRERLEKAGGEEKELFYLPFRFASLDKEDEEDHDLQTRPMLVGPAQPPAAAGEDKGEMLIMPLLRQECFSPGSIARAEKENSYPFRILFIKRPSGAGG